MEWACEGGAGAQPGWEVQEAAPYLIARAPRPLRPPPGRPLLPSRLRHADCAIEQVVVDLTAAHLPARLAGALAAELTALQRAGRRVALVRCPAALAAALWRAGLRDAAHAPSLGAATSGQAGGEAHGLDLWVRSGPEALDRVRQVARAVAAAGRGLPGEWVQAITEAAAHALEHGCPEGPRNHLRLSFALGERDLVVDVADQDAGGAPPPSARVCAGRVEYLRGARGGVLRLVLARPRGPR